MNTTSTETQPIRAGVFASATDAKRAADRLLAAGFTADHIIVVCSDHSKDALFQQFKHQEPAGTFAPKVR